MTSDVARGVPAPPGEPCLVSASSKWSETEQWVWSQVCTGRTADLNERDHTTLDPRSSGGWTDARKLRTAFLEAILLYEPWRGAQTRKGVRIVGAWFDEYVDLAGSELPHELRLEKCRFMGSADFSTIQAASILSLSGSAIEGELVLRLVTIRGLISFAGLQVRGSLYMDSTGISGSLLMGDGAEFADVDLEFAKIGGEIDLYKTRVTGKLKLTGATIGGSLRMSKGEFGEVHLIRTKINSHLALDSGTKVTGALIMDAVVVGGNLFMRDGKFTEVNLRGATIGGQIALNGTKTTGKLSMDAAVVGGNLFMRDNSEFAEVNLSGAKIGGDLVIMLSKFAGIGLDGARIGGDLVMRLSEFANVGLGGAKISGEINLTSSSVSDDLYINAVVVGGDVSLSNSNLKDIDLTFAKVEGNLDVRGAVVARRLDLTGARVTKELLLADTKSLPIWGDQARLVLRNAQVDALLDEPNAWPTRLDLKGFTYERLGGVGDDFDVKRRGETKWFIHWLAKDEPYSPQPYKQLANVLTGMGHGEEASDVLYAGRERARHRAWSDGHKSSWLGQSLLKWTIGYGYGSRHFRALWWVFALVGIGWLVLRLTGQDQVLPRDGKPGMTLGPIYALDMLLPIIRLREAHYAIELEGIARYYFYFHKMMGYVLGSFLVAGISGLTR